MCILDELYKISSYHRYCSQKFKKKFREQWVLVFPEEQRFQILSLLKPFEQKNGSYVLIIKGTGHKAIIMNEKPVQNVKIVQARTFESRLLSLDQPDPRRILLAKKRLKQAETGELRGRPLLLLQENVQEALQITLRQRLQASMKRRLCEPHLSMALERLALSEKVLLTDFETAPIRLRVNWKESDGGYKAKMLSNGISIIFEEKMVGAKGWVPEVIRQAHAEMAFMNGVYFPKNLLNLASRKRVIKSNKV